MIVLAFHGAIHLLGFVKAFGYADIKELKLPVSKKLGLIWLLSFLIFLLSAALLGLNSSSWTWVALFAVAVSQFAIITSWGDAKFGTIINILVLVLLGLPVIL